MKRTGLKIAGGFLSIVKFSSNYFTSSNQPFSTSISIKLENNLVRGVTPTVVYWSNGQKYVQKHPPIFGEASINIYIPQPTSIPPFILYLEPSIGIEGFDVIIESNIPLSYGLADFEDSIYLDCNATGCPAFPPLGELVVPEKKYDVQSTIRSNFETAEETRSPLAIDLDGDGVETVSVDNGVYFDHDGNGFAEKTGWISSDDALLVRDINGNGQIDDGSELFGDQTILSNGEKAANGFEALADLDSNHDGVFDGDDEAFGEIKVWQDLNQNGVVRFYSKTGYMSVQSMKKHHRSLKSVQFQTLGRAIYIPSSFAKHNHYII